MGHDTHHSKPFPFAGLPSTGETLLTRASVTEVAKKELGAHAEKQGEEKSLPRCLGWSGV